LLQLVAIARNPVRCRRDGEIALIVGHEWLLGDAVDIRAAADELDEVELGSAAASCKS
jgi:hypothetical protein